MSQYNSTCRSVPESAYWHFAKTLSNQPTNNLLLLLSWQLFATRKQRSCRITGLGDLASLCTCFYFISSHNNVFSLFAIGLSSLIMSLRCTYPFHSVWKKHIAHVCYLLHSHTHIHTHTLMCAGAHTYPHTHACTHSQTHTQARTCTHTHTHTHKHTHTHTYTHTQI